MDESVKVIVLIGIIFIMLTPFLVVVGIFRLFLKFNRVQSLSFSFLLIYFIEILLIFLVQSDSFSAEPESCGAKIYPRLFCFGYVMSMIIFFYYLMKYHENKKQENINVTLVFAGATFVALFMMAPDYLDDIKWLDKESKVIMKLLCNVATTVLPSFFAYQLNNIKDDGNQATETNKFPTKQEYICQKVIKKNYEITEKIYKVTENTIKK